MSKPEETDTEPVLDAELLGLIGQGVKPADSDTFPAQHQDCLQARILARIDAETQAAEAGLITVHSNDGPWERIAPKIEKKVLQRNEANGTESYLLRVEAGATAPSHHHEADEICIMLEGEVNYGELYLRAGDYHFAPRGSIHGPAACEDGALLFIHTGIDSQSPV